MALVDPRLAARALAPGRIRALALELAEVMARDPARATGVVRGRLREARHLHGAERRLVADATFDLVRYAGIFGRLGLSDAGAKWEAWVDWQAGKDDRIANEIAAAIAEGDLAAVAGVPPSVAVALQASLGAEAMAFAIASNRRAPVVIRANRARVERDGLAAALATRGVSSEPSPLAPDALRIGTRANLEGTPEFRGGLFEIQDDASQAVAAWAGAGTADTILDFCAGAGGKSLALAALGWRVVATDTRPAALAELDRRARRAGHRVEISVAAPTGPIRAAWRGRFPRVLVDAPCTGTGVWRRHPELRPRAIEHARYAIAQLDIALRASEAVAPGGTLVYATCSVLTAEGEAVVEEILDRTGWVRREPDRRWTPHHDGSDGFFAASVGPPT